MLSAVNPRNPRNPRLESTLALRIHDVTTMRRTRFPSSREGLVFTRPPGGGFHADEWPPVAAIKGNTRAKLSRTLAFSSTLHARDNDERTDLRRDTRSKSWFAPLFH